MSEVAHRSASRGLTICVGVCTALLVFSFIRWWLVEWSTAFFLPVVYLLLLALFAGALGWSALRLLRHGWRAGTPLLVCLAMLRVWFVIPFTAIWLRLNYWLHLESREAIVAEVLAGSLRPNVDYNARLIALPPGMPQVSMGGNEIMVEEHQGQKLIFFYTFRGILDNYSGFLFVPEGADPIWYSDLSEPCCTELVRFAERWYWVSHR